MESLPTHLAVDALDLARYTFRAVYDELRGVADGEVTDFVRANGLLTDHEYRQMFTRQQREALARNDVTDVVLIYKLLQTVCGLEPHHSSLWRTPSEALEYHLRNAKLLSNDLAHNMHHAPGRVVSVCSRLRAELGIVVSKVEDRIGKRLDHVRDRMKTRDDVSTPAYRQREYVLLPLEQLNKVIFRMVYKHYNRDDVNVKDFCFENLGFSEKLFTRTFLKTQRQAMERDPPVDELDPYVLFKVLERAIDKEDVLQGYLKSMKNMRNEVVHEGAKIECSYESFVLAERVLLELGARSGRTFGEILVQMGRELFPEADIESSMPAVMQATPRPAVTSPAVTTRPAVTLPAATTTPAVTLPAATTTPAVTLPAATTRPAVTLPAATTRPAVKAATTTPTVTLPAATTTPAVTPAATTTPAVTPPATATPAVTVATTTPSATPASSTYRREDVNLVRAFAALRRGGPAARTFAKVFEGLFPKGLNHLEEHCQNESRYSSEELRSLRRELKKPLERDAEPGDLDITLLYKCLGYVGLARQDTWSTLDGSLEQYLYRVKTKRNFLAHEVVRYTDNDLAQLFEDLQRWLPQILRLLRRDHGRDVPEELIVDVKDDLQSIYADPLPDGDVLEDYFRRMGELREALSSRTLARSRVELRAYYAHSEYRVVTPVTWCRHASHASWDVNELYTELEVVGSSSDEAETVSTRDLFSRLTSKVVLVEGAAGSGKTSLCKFALNSWKDASPGMDGLVNVDLLVFLQCRNVVSDSLTSFLRDELLKETFRDVELADVVRSLAEARVLFVVDGFDEAGPHGRKVLMEALRKFPTGSFVVTTRPEVRSDLEVLIAEAPPRELQVYRVVGFRDSIRESYVRKVFGVLGGDAGPFLRRLKDLDRHLGSFARLPLTLALLAMLWNEDEGAVGEVTTVTRIYSQMLGYFKGRLVKRQKDGPLGTRHPKDIGRSVDKWMRSLARVAWEMLRKNETTLSERDETALRDEADHLGVDPTDALSCLLQCNATVTASRRHEDWEFFHRTVQEFLAASHLSGEVLKGGAASSLRGALGLTGTSSLEGLREYSRLVQFVAGLLVEDDSMTRERAREVLQLFDRHLPWTYEGLADLSRECGSSRDFANSLGVLFEGQTLEDELVGFEPESLRCVLEKTSLSLPREGEVVIAIASKDAGNVGPLLDLVTSRGCPVRVMLPANSPRSVRLVTETLLQLDDPSGVEILFGFQVHDAFPTLVEVWPWSAKPLNVTFTKPAILLLWFKFMACLALHAVKPSKIQFSGASPEQDRSVEAFVRRLGIGYGRLDARPGEFIITM